MQITEVFLHVQYSNPCPISSNKYMQGREQALG